MPSNQLNGKQVAILACDGFEESELRDPLAQLLDNGAAVEIISLEGGTIRGWEKGHWAMEPVKVTRTLDKSNAADYDALVLPGGVMNPDKLRTVDAVLQFVRAFAQAGKPIAAICHAPWTLIDAGLVKDKRVTSFPSIRTDLENAGAKWVDESVVVDNGLITSRNPNDLPAFNAKLIEEILEGIHA